MGAKNRVVVYACLVPLDVVRNVIDSLFLCLEQGIVFLGPCMLALTVKKKDKKRQSKVFLNYCFPFLSFYFYLMFVEGTYFSKGIDLRTPVFAFCTCRKEENGRR